MKAEVALGAMDVKWGVEFILDTCAYGWCWQDGYEQEWLFLRLPLESD